MAKPVRLDRAAGKSAPSGGSKVHRGVYTPTSHRVSAAGYRREGFRLTSARRLDLLGGALVVLAIFSAISLVSRASSIAMWWAGVLKWLVGWGAVVLPLGLAACGAYLLLRRVESLPRPPLGRVGGWVLLYLNLLTLLHFFGGGLDNPYLLAEYGQGGGYLGASVLNLLVEALGILGAFLVLLAWLLGALTLSFKVSPGEAASFARERLRGMVKPAGTPAVARAPAARATGVDLDEFDPLPEERSGESTPIEQVPPLQPERQALRRETVWELPRMEEILESGVPRVENEKLNLERARVIEETLESLGAPGRVVEILSGPSVTLFGVEPDYLETRGGSMRVRVAKIASLSHDLALALAATRIRIQAPVPGQNYVGIEVPNETTAIVRLRDIIDSPAFRRKKSPLRIPLGKDVSGNPITADLATMPHLLIAGATGSGKSVCVNSILTSLLIHNTPDDLRLILVDPKRVELIGYNGIPHLLSPVIVEVERVVGALQWMLREMESRYLKFSAAGARNLEDYNSRMQLRGERPLPILVIVIDEMADLMMLAQNETEAAIARLAQMARATGLHLILATQRPSTDIITGNIKANFPARIAFAVASNTDSRVILDQPGAEHLLGRGDLLYQAPDAGAPVRMQGTYVSEEEIDKVVSYWKAAAHPEEANAGQEFTTAAEGLGTGANYQQPDLFGEADLGRAREDPLTDEVISLVRREGRASISLLQKRLRIGYTRAARLIDSLEEMAIIGPQLPNSQTREVLDYGEMAPPADDGA